MQVGKGKDTHVLRQAGVVGIGERGGNAGVQVCVTVGEEVSGSRTQLIQCNNVVTMYL